MKKGIVLFLFFILILNIFIISVKAQLNPPLVPGLGDINSETGLPNELEKIKGIGENLTDSEIRSQYLKKEWGQILEKNKFFGPIIKGYGKISPYTDPIFKYTLGITPSLTWLFVLTLTLWVCLLIYIIRIFELFPILSGFTRVIISIGVMVIISLTGLIKKLAEKIIDVISFFTTWWMQLIGIGIIIIGLVVALIFSKNLQKIFKTMKEKREKDEEKLNREKLKAEVEIAEAFTKGITGK